MKEERYKSRNVTVLLIASFLATSGCQQSTQVELSDEQVEDIVRRSYQYVAMYNVNNKFAMDPGNPLGTGGWNRVKANTTLADHTLKAIPRPNNDTLYVIAMLDLREEPVILEAPAFDSKYLSLMVTGYDHYVNIPMSTRLGDFSEPSRILFYTERTPGYAGEAVEGVDKVAEMSGDFVGAVYRVMPHADEPERLRRNLDAMQDVKVMTLSEYRTGDDATAGTDPAFPDFGESDFDTFENNLLEVMQFVFNHTTFDPDDEIDQMLLAAYEPLGIEPGRAFDPSHVGRIDGARFRKAAEEIAPAELARATDPKFLDDVTGLYQPKGQMTPELLLFQSIIGPVGQPAAEAVYPAIATTDGTPMNAMHDYVIRMTPDELPPATAFWSATLYDTENGFFIPNDRRKYSVGENAGMQLNADGGIGIHIAAARPEGVSEDNWLPLERGDYGIDVIMRIYAPDLERFKNWTAPKAEIVE